MIIPRHFANQLSRNFTKLMGGDAASGILLIIVAILAAIVLAVIGPAVMGARFQWLLGPLDVGGEVFLRKGAYWFVR